jgi:hypothetical protein
MTSGEKRMNKSTAKELYNIYQCHMYLVEDIGVENWDDLDDANKNAWEAVAKFAR